MNNVLAAVARIGIVSAGIVLLIISRFGGWLGLAGVLLVCVGSQLIIATARDAAYEERLEDERNRFGNVHFGDDDEDARR